MQIPFTKMHGAGNDFILIENRPGFFKGDEYSTFGRLCDRHFGIGADGLMLIKQENQHSFNMMYFNANGKPGEMCGNGARCAVYFSHLLNKKIRKFNFDVWGNRYQAEVLSSETIKLFWGNSPEFIDLPGMKEIIPAEFLEFAFIDSGVPHLVLKVKSGLHSLDVRKQGIYFRNHPVFKPDGTNVDFIEVKKNRIKIRTFERGVEGETLACGTGAIAAAFAAKRWQNISFPVDINAAGGQLGVGFDEELEKTWLSGPVRLVFSGYFEQSRFSS